MKVPNRCALCSSQEGFTTREHIVPESLGNDVLVLPPGWVCDLCNNVCSAFESRALHNSILGFERCRLGVVTKKAKPAKATVGGIEWIALPDEPPNVLSANVHHKQTPNRLPLLSHGMTAFKVHDKSNADISRLLLKIGVELLAVRRFFENPTSDCQFHRDACMSVLGIGPVWPYALLLDGRAPAALRSVLAQDPVSHREALYQGFDLFLHQIGEHEIVFFQYGSFLGAASLSDRSLNWTAQLKAWSCHFVACPAEYSSCWG